MIICPNLSNPEVAREFNELVQATSEQAAYHIWSLNNGNAIDRAPNGAPSKLFLTLLEHYNGDRTKAIQAKAKTYGRSFLNWFGDWTNDPTSSSKVVDKNGEPLVVWHQDVDSEISDFGKRPLASYPVTFFSNTPRKLYGEYGYPVFLNLKNPLYEDALITGEAFDGQGPGLQNTINNGYDSAIGLYSMIESGQKPETINISDVHEYVSFYPNQIKSIDNEGHTPYEGTFSRENDNIYDQLKSLGEELMKKCKG